MYGVSDPEVNCTGIVLYALLALFALNPLVQDKAVFSAMAHYTKKTLFYLFLVLFAVTRVSHLSYVSVSHAAVPHPILFFIYSLFARNFATNIRSSRTTCTSQESRIS